MRPFVLVLALTGAAACGNQSVDSPAADAGTSLAVTYQGSSHAVGLASLPTVRFQDVDCASLSDLVAAALPGSSLEALQANFVSEDGFNPASRANCATAVPVPGADFGGGYVERATRNLMWDPALGYPGCLSVRALGEIQVLDR